MIQHLLETLITHLKKNLPEVKQIKQEPVGLAPSIALYEFEFAVKNTSLSETTIQEFQQEMRVEIYDSSPVALEKWTSLTLKEKLMPKFSALILFGAINALIPLTSEAGEIIDYPQCQKAPDECLKEAILKLQAEVETQAQAQQEKLKALNKQIVALETKIQALKKENAALASQLQQRVRALETKIQALKKENAALASQPENSLRTKERGIFKDRLKDGHFGPQMVWIPAGRFRMGDIQGGGDSDEKPVHYVSINRFAMSRYEVTFAEYDKFVEVTGREKPDDEGWGRGNRPVINVSWHDANAYAKWLSEETGQKYRLPTEAEWEYAARAGTETKYWWGNEIGSNKANCRNKSCGDRFKYTAPVGSFAPNPFGLYDTAGNVWEWTCSKYSSSYNGSEKSCSSNGHASSNPLSLRGGSWGLVATWVRSANRNVWTPIYRFSDLGFRLARH
jgi:formylglycine-generating enzyme required for sulfatase activity